MRKCYPPTGTPNISTGDPGAAFQAIGGLPREGNYVKPLQDMLINQEIILETVPKGLFFQSLASVYAGLVDYPNSLQAWDAQVKKGEERDLASIKVEVAQLKKEDAQDAILGEAQTHSVIMINEAHHIGMHRAFVTGLLQPLYDAGFRYLAIETLLHRDQEGLNQRKFPLLRTGVYSTEPFYGEMIRHALNIGFELVPYSNSNRDPNVRDSLQAGELMAILDRDAQAKILVHAGFGHIRESTPNGWGTMAQVFKKKTGINPLTIDQVELCERSGREFESDWYAAIMEKAHKSPVIMKKEDAYWTIPENKGVFDMQVVHPRSDFPQGRPSWVELDPSRKRLDVKKDILGNEKICWVQAFVSSELDDFSMEELVPVDQFCIGSDNPSHCLWLPENRDFLLVFRDIEGNIIQKREFNF